MVVYSWEYHLFLWAMASNFSIPLTEPTDGSSMRILHRSHFVAFNIERSWSFRGLCPLKSNLWPLISSDIVPFQWRVIPRRLTMHLIVLMDRWKRGTDQGTSHLFFGGRPRGFSVQIFPQAICWHFFNHPPSLVNIAIQQWDSWITSCRDALQAGKGVTLL